VPISEKRLTDSTVSSEANATNKSGGEAETLAWSGGVSGWARAAELAEPERASHSAAPAVQHFNFWKRQLTRRVFRETLLEERSLPLVRKGQEMYVMLGGK